MTMNLMSILGFSLAELELTLSVLADPPILLQNFMFGAISVVQLHQSLHTSHLLIRSSENKPSHLDVKPYNENVNSLLVLLSN
jgi:hypothetical protein